MQIAQPGGGESELQRARRARARARTSESEAAQLSARRLCQRPGAPRPRLGAAPILLPSSSPGDPSPSVTWVRALQAVPEGRAERLNREEGGRAAECPRVVHFSPGGLVASEIPGCSNLLSVEQVNSKRAGEA